VRFDPTAQHIASGSMDRSICESQLKLSILLRMTDASSANPQYFGTHMVNARITAL
jgi:hypothetical protein